MVEGSTLYKFLNSDCLKTVHLHKLCTVFLGIKKPQSCARPETYHRHRELKYKIVVPNACSKCTQVLLKSHAKS